MSDQSLSAVEATEPDSAIAPLPTCPCGHDRSHYRVSGDGELKPWAWFLLIFGISAKPIRINWRCRMCDVTFDSSTDPDLLRRRGF